MICPSTVLSYRRPNVAGPTLPGFSDVSCSWAPVRALSLCWVNTSSPAASAENAPSARRIEKGVRSRPNRRKRESETQLQNECFGRSDAKEDIAFPLKSDGSMSRSHLKYGSEAYFCRIGRAAIVRALRGDRSDNLDPVCKVSKP